MASGWIHPRIGELWRSTEALFVGDVGSSLRAGVFVVLARYDHPLDAYLSFEAVDFLVADGIRRGWNSSWVENNSEVLDVVE